MKNLLATLLIAGVAGLYSASAADATSTLWDKSCASCHGKDGKGQTAMGKKFKVKDYTDAKVQEALKDEEMTKVIKQGVKGDKDGDAPKMKPFADILKDDEIKALVKYVRDFKK